MSSVPFFQTASTLLFTLLNMLLISILKSLKQIKQNQTAIFMHSSSKEINSYRVAVGGEKNLKSMLEELDGNLSTDVCRLQFV